MIAYESDEEHVKDGSSGGDGPQRPTGTCPWLGTECFPTQLLLYLHILLAEQMSAPPRIQLTM